MSLVVSLPEGYAPERRYIMRVLLEEYLGLEVRFEPASAYETVIRAPNGSELVLPDVLFSTPPGEWLTRASLPQSPMRSWSPEELEPLAPCAGIVRSLPVLYARTPDGLPFDAWSERRIVLSLDIAGSCFYMLTRYEEAVKQDRDRHGRFPASAAHAVCEGYLERPLVDEYVELLWGCLEFLCPVLRRAPREFRVRATHDVDNPLFWPRIGAWSLARSTASKALKWGRPDFALADVTAWWRARGGHHDGDPYDTFDALMESSEREGLQSAFYFQTGHTGSRFDCSYHIGTPHIDALMTRIHRRGHEIGLHPSYGTFDAPALIADEFETLKRHCSRLGIEQPAWGGRHHYLRWRTPGSFAALDRAGLAYDSTLGFAEAPGFRTGTCREYPAFDLKARKALALRERPLVVMDRSLLSSQYLGFSADDVKALDLALELKRQCARHGGEFTILWHNAAVVSPAEKRLYEQVLTSPP